MLLITSETLFLLSFFIPTAQASPTNLPQQHQKDISMPRILHQGNAYGGRGTWYYPGLGACGSVGKPTDFIVSVNHLQFQQDICYKELVLVNPANHKTTRARIQDMCPGCGYGSVDMSPALFSALAETGLKQGMMQVKWSFVDV